MTNKWNELETTEKNYNLRVTNLLEELTMLNETIERANCLLNRGNKYIDLLTINSKGTIDQQIDGIMQNIEDLEEVKCICKEIEEICKKVEAKKKDICFARERDDLDRKVN